MRTFIALELPDEVKNEIVKLQNYLAKLDLFSGKFTEPNDLHLTLKFMGDIADDKLKLIKEKLSNLKFKEFEAETDILGVFNERFIRIIWISLKSKELFELQKDIDEILAHDFPKEPRFMAHITIARPKFIRKREELLKTVRTIKFEKLKFKINTIKFKESKLLKKGPEYSDLMVVKANPDTL
ncbi:MAG: RNA 2',3'-cyclic phosphodiesterase [Candidatus Pacearchaeota archaeon]